MYRYFLFLLSIFSTSSFSQSPQIEFQKSYGGTAQDRGYGVIKVNDGYAVVGHADSWDGDLTGNHGGSDFWLMQLDSSLNIIWQKALGGTGDDNAKSISLTLDGGFIISGTTNSEDGDVIGLHVDFIPHDDYWIVKTDSTGTIEWQKCLGGTYMDWGHQIVQTSDSGYIVIGEGMSTDGDITGHIGSIGDDDFWIVKLDNLGNLLWQKCFGGTEMDQGYSICETSDGGFIACGTTLSVDSQVTYNHGGFDVWVLKIDNTGNLQWQKSYGGSGGDGAFKIIRLGSGYIFIGNTDSNNGDVVGFHGTGDNWVVAIDSIGGILWQRCYGGSGPDVGKDIKSTTDNGFILTGYTGSVDGDVTGWHGVADYWVIKIDSVGGIVWQKCIGGTGFDGGYETIEDSNNSFITVGYSQSDDGDITNNHGGQCGPPVCDDFWVTKLSISLTGILEPASISNYFNVYLNLSGTLSLNFDASENEITQLKVFDSRGRIIFDKPLSVKNGYNKYEVYPGDIPEGLYLVTLYMKGSTSIKKVVKNF